MHSINICMRMLSTLNGKMLEFSFRNGYLRRKYDSLKYCLRNVENIYFELSMLLDEAPSNLPLQRNFAIFDDGGATEEGAQQSHQQPKKRSKPSSAAEASAPPVNSDDVAVPATGDNNSDNIDMLDLEGLERIRLRMEEQDALREDVIKKSRDVQKQSKLAIYAVQRGNYKDAEDKLNKAKEIALAILQSIEQTPTLRFGSLSNSLEEWAEGYMCLVWCTQKELVPMSAMPIPLQTGEYIGALSDFTGEIGRIAIACATKRDKASVLEILQADLIISTFINDMNFTNKFFKKNDAVLTNMKKVM
jgi:predicted translin family RNA/ssDNA-binding protein